MFRDVDIKKLWGLAAGRCSYPGCHVQCIQLLVSEHRVVVGEMAHLIAKSPKGPRGPKDSPADHRYGNLILLCPTHHTLVDKAPNGQFPPDLLRRWKSEHEARVRRALSVRQYSDVTELANDVELLLQENHQAWLTYGPESSVAKTNPFSSAAMIWSLRKLDTIVPNNRKIIEILRRHRALFSPTQYRTCTQFIEHAEAFELSCYERQDSDAVPRFPTDFTALIERMADD